MKNLAWLLGMMVVGSNSAFAGDCVGQLNALLEYRDAASRMEVSATAAGVDAELAEVQEKPAYRSIYLAEKARLTQESARQRDLLESAKDEFIRECVVTQ